MLRRMRDRALKALDMYAEGGTILDARNKFALSGLDFARALQRYSDVAEMYALIKDARGRAMMDEAYQISTDTSLPPASMRVMADIRIKLGQLISRQEFGERLSIEVTQTPNIIGALEARKATALLPLCDPVDATDAEYEELPALSAPSTTDKQSVTKPKRELVPALKGAAPELHDIWGD